MVSNNNTNTLISCQNGDWQETLATDAEENWADDVNYGNYDGVWFITKFNMLFAMTLWLIKVIRLYVIYFKVFVSVLKILRLN